MIRFFAAPSDISGDTISLTIEDAEHIRSLRLRPAELFIVCDGEGADYVCALAADEGQSPAGSDAGRAAAATAGRGAPQSGASRRGQSAGSVAHIVRRTDSPGEPTVNCHVFIALAKGDRMDYAVQKSVELGAHSIALFSSERCIPAPGDLSKKTARLQRIALETAKQCGRGRIPAVSYAGSLREAVDAAQHIGTAFFLYEDETTLHFKQALECADIASGRVAVITGPEGGFEPSEAEYARSKGMHIVTLGPRILRCETAPAAALCAVMFFTGNL